MSSPGFIQVPPNAGGAKVEVNSPNAGLDRQVINVGDATSGNFQKINAASQAEVVTQGAPNFNNIQVTVTAGAGELVTSNILRRSVLIYCKGSSTNVVYIGNGPGVTPSNGLPIGGAGNPAGIILETNAAVWLICDTGNTQVVAISEVYDNA